MRCVHCDKPLNITHVKEHLLNAGEDKFSRSDEAAASTVQDIITAREALGARGAAQPQIIGKTPGQPVNWYQVLIGLLALFER